MSTNPFRRSSLKDPSGHGNSNTSAVQGQTGRSSPLTLNTKAPASGQKHVNFASPPAIPISPVSYPPSSPESQRISPAFTTAQLVSPTGTGYGDALQLDPFHAEAEADEDDGAIQQAIQNAKANVERVARDPQQEKEEAVRRTLSKFASIPRKPPVTQSNASTVDSRRQTMDVDAFARLLLTGDSKQDDQHPPTSGTQPVSKFYTASNESNSSEESLSDPADTGSDIGNTPAAKGVLSTVETEQNKKKPPPPKSRHGKAIADTRPPSTSEQENRPSITRTPSSSSSVILTNGEETINPTKRAPPPPLSRRKSHNQNNSSRGAQAQQTAASDRPTTIPSPENVNTSKTPPPPPPTRRPNSMFIRHTSSDLPVMSEETENSDQSAIEDRRSSVPGSIRATKSQTAAKRLSMGVLNPPPAPPPRRNRGSSRSSMDSQRPVLVGGAGNTESTRSSVEYTRPEPDDANTMPDSNVTDILADLAALQQEVDAARRNASN